MKNFKNDFKSYKKAEEHAISVIAKDSDNIGYVILSERKNWFRKYFYINYYFKNPVENPANAK